MTRDLVHGEIWLAPAEYYPIVLQVRHTRHGLQLVPLEPQDRGLTYGEASERYGPLTLAWRYAHVAAEHPGRRGAVSDEDRVLADLGYYDAQQASKDPAVPDLDADIPPSAAAMAQRIASRLGWAP